MIINHSFLSSNGMVNMQSIFLSSHFTFVTHYTVDSIHILYTVISQLWRGLDMFVFQQFVHKVNRSKCATLFLYTISLF